MGSGSLIRKYWHLIIPSAVFLIHCTIILFILPGEPLKDERVFYPAAVSFSQSSDVWTLEFLRKYDSPQTPLSFIISGLLLNISSSITILRMFDALAVFLIILLFCQLVRSILPGRLFSPLLLVFTFLLNPYLHFIGVLYYTDAMYLLFISLAVFMLISGREGILYYFSLFTAPLVRQFGVIYAAGSFIDGLKREYPYFTRQALLSLLSLSGLLFFLILWKGLMPVNSFYADMIKIRTEYGEVFAYIPAYSLSALGFYLAPVFVFLLKDQPGRSRAWLWGAGAVLFYSIFPARQNYMTAVVQPYNLTLGFYHKIFLQAAGDPLFHIILALFAFLAGAALYVIYSAAGVKRILKIWIAFFFMMSFFNLQAWDKYLLDAELIVLLSAAFIFSRRRENKPA